MVQIHSSRRYTSLPDYRPAERTCAHPSGLISEVPKLNKNGENSCKFQAFAKRSLILTTCNYLDFARPQLDTSMRSSSLILRWSEVALTHPLLSSSVCLISFVWGLVLDIIWPLNILPIRVVVSRFSPSGISRMVLKNRTLIDGNIQRSDDVKNKPLNKGHQTRREWSECVRPRSG